MKINLPSAVLALSGVIALTYYSYSTELEQQNTGQTAQLKQSSIAKPNLAGNQNASTTQDLRKPIKIAKSSQLWQAVAPQQHPETMPENLNVEYIKIDDPNAMKFSEGQQVSLLIPQENKSFFGVIDESTRAFGGDVKISSGTIENGDELASFSITEGKNTTFITVATGESIYQVEINNQTGIGVVLDDRELNQYRQNEDGILPPPEGIS